jgi:hypothetical protein
MQAGVESWLAVVLDQSSADTYLTNKNSVSLPKLFSSFSPFPTSLPHESSLSAKFIEFDFLHVLLKIHLFPHTPLLCGIIAHGIEDPI